MRVDTERVGGADAERIVGGEQPDAGEGIDHEPAGAPGVTDLGLEGPAIRADVDQPGRIVLAGRRDDLDAGAEQRCATAASSRTPRPTATGRRRG